MKIHTTKAAKRIAILGGGPSGLFVYKRLTESSRTDITIEIFESGSQLGPGMPYSSSGANIEHITNVSANEIPEIATSIHAWIQTIPEQTLKEFNIDRDHFNEYKVLPRLLFGQYLKAQFTLLQNRADSKGICTHIHLNSKVTDIIDLPERQQTRVIITDSEEKDFDSVIICTGHHWPITYEGAIPGYFDSPYPPAKLALKRNHAVAIRGSSLTAIDAIRTLARHNGTFIRDTNEKLVFHPAEESEAFKLVMHSRNGLLPAIRFHLEDPLLSKSALLGRDELISNMKENDGFLSLDFVFEKDFKNTFINKDPEFYAKIKDHSLEDFVTLMMDMREHFDPFFLFRAEYKEAERSIRQRESIYWKEMLAVLSFAMNYPAKYLSAEDMIRLQTVLMPLIAIVIAFVPQSSCDELLALHDAGRLEIVPVGADSNVEPESNGGITYHYISETDEPRSVYFETFVDCTGQPHLSFDAFPFRSLITGKTISPARLKFRSAKNGKDALTNGKSNVEKDTNGAYYLSVPGIAINDNFQVLEQSGAVNKRIYIMAVPYIGGYNPDYSGLDFCEEVSDKIVNSILSESEPIIPIASLQL